METKEIQRETTFILTGYLIFKVKKLEGKVYYFIKREQHFFKRLYFRDSNLKLACSQRFLCDIHVSIIHYKIAHSKETLKGGKHMEKYIRK